MKCIEASFLGTKARRSLIQAPNQSSSWSLIVIEPWLGWLNAQMIATVWHDVLQFRFSLPCFVLIFYFDCTSNRCMECYRTVWKESTCNLQLANSYVPDLVVRQAQCNSIWAPIKKTPTQGCNPRYTTPSRWLLGPAAPRKQTSSANRACTLAIMPLWYVYFHMNPKHMYITCIFALHIKYVIPNALELGSPKM